MKQVFVIVVGLLILVGACTTQPSGMPNAPSSQGQDASGGESAIPSRNASMSPSSAYDDFQSIRSGILITGFDAGLGSDMRVNLPTRADFLTTSQFETVREDLVRQFDKKLADSSAFKETLENPAYTRSLSSPAIRIMEDIHVTLNALRADVLIAQDVERFEAIRNEANSELSSARSALIAAVDTLSDDTQARALQYARSYVQTLDCPSASLLVVELEDLIERRRNQITIATKLSGIDIAAKECENLKAR